MINHNLTCDAFQERLSEYLEGTLPDSALADVELHIAACASCRSLVEDLRAIVQGASTLAPLVPSRDLWPGIAARIEPKVLPFAPATREARPWSRLTLGAIAAGLVAVTALSTWQLTRSRETQSTVAQTPPVALPAQPDSTPPSLAMPGASESVVTATVPVPAPQMTPTLVSSRTPRPDAATTYASEIDKLRAVFDQQSDVLDPRTRAILSTSLRTIDSAIAEARAALSRDPASQFLSQQLNKSLEQKLGLLRKAAFLSGT
jgi:hypothetical protein